MTDSPELAAPQAELASALDNSTELITGFTPVPRRFNRGDVWTEQVQRDFIDFLADTGSVEAACRMVGRSPASAYRLRRHPLGAGFAGAWQAAADFGIRRIEDYAIDRATNGVEVPVFAYGDKIATRRVYNDQLVMFMLRSRMPDRYCDGGARAMSAIDKRVLARLKKQWREEWEEEQRANEPKIENVRAEILRKVEAIEQADRRRETPRERELREAYHAERDARVAREEEEDRERLRAMNPSWPCLERLEEEEENDEEAEDEEVSGEDGPAAEPPCTTPPLDLARAQILGAVEERIRQLEAREGEGGGRQDGGTAGPGDIPAGQAPSVRCADTSPVNGGGPGSANPPPFTGEGDHEAEPNGGGGQSADTEQAPSGSLRSPPPP